MLESDEPQARGVAPWRSITPKVTSKLQLKLNGNEAEFSGPGNENLKLLEKLLDIRLNLRGEQVKLTGQPENVQAAQDLLSQFARAANRGHVVQPAEVRAAVANLTEPPSAQLGFDEVVATSITVGSRKVVKPRTAGQKRLIGALFHSDIVLAIGPAGTGKTYLSVAVGLANLHRGAVNRLILARPAVEAGESLGYLPGAPEEKIAPYLRPLYDALYAMLKRDRVLTLIEHGVIEIVPLAYMRGRTLDNAYVILDEAQNTTHRQLKMFLTRLGGGSKAAVVGDVTQIDLPRPRESGLLLAQDFLADIEGLSFVHLTRSDIVRHGLVARIVEAYERFDSAAVASDGGENDDGTGEEAAEGGGNVTNDGATDD
jgi:phosphate starvation-inducible PhoH-like protein